MQLDDHLKGEFIQKFPLLSDMMAYKTVHWHNPKYNSSAAALKLLPFSVSEMLDAEARLKRFAPYIMAAFPETKDAKGIIESELLSLNNYHDDLRVYLKCDHNLPISGSVKARGGIYEILRYAEALLVKNHLLSLDDPYDILTDTRFKTFFSHYNIVVSSTGNLGLSIGIISAKLGFKVYVHMSHDAMTWKKDLLRSIGAEVIEHASDYSKAVSIGRQEAEKNPNSYFVDDENSLNLFMGYAVSAFRLKKQINDLHIQVTKEAPLFVYIPCGVGGGPGGIAYGLKVVFGDLVHCYFVEPTHAPCMLLGMMTETHDRYSVQDFGMDNDTIADGLAVGRASKFVGKTIDHLLAGISTVEDEELLSYLDKIYKQYHVFLEPSALAGFKGLDNMLDLDVPMIGHHHIQPEMVRNGTHIVWSTGGNMVPKSVQETYLNKIKNK